ncbi:YaiI/YqxD family protein [Nitrincola schmidtii]|uniref:YaiI/YqxD family protein n=1 Tax=Nitrincola schmidtii TaxID=1730894 RepID=UPI00124D9C6F|nr:YaiI/YqxD family protein [Nitrincola schmidtii]
MKIWVDADACPVVIKEILFKAANRAEIPLILVANQSVRVPPSDWISSVRVSSGFDVADNEIVRQCEAGDLVITSDIPLAAEVIAKEGQALSPRGEMFTKDSIGSRLNMRDFLETLRSSGEHTGGPAPLHVRDRQAFAAELDKCISRYQRKRQR